MLYESLYKMYYKNQQQYDEQYKLRFNSPFTRHFPLKIKEYNHRNEYEIFYCSTEEIILLYDKILSTSLKLQKLLLNIPQVGIEQFQNSCLVEEIKASNDIEGVTSTRKEIVFSLKSPSSERPNLRFGSIINKYLNIIYRKTIKISDCNDIRNLFDEILKNEIKQNDLPDGKIFRRESVDIVTATQKVIHQGLYPEDKIIKYITEALNILHDKDIPSLIKIAIFHYLFGYIRPFYDGNGRMSRFITSYFLAKYIEPTVALQLSVLLKIKRKEYYKMFEIANSSINKGDLTPFIINTLELISSAVEHTKKTLESKLTKYQAYLKTINKLNLKDKTLFDIYNILLQAAIFSNIGATISEIKSTLKKSENTIMSRLKQIPKSLIIKNEQTRPYHYKLNLESAEWKNLLI